MHLHYDHAISGSAIDDKDKAVCPVMNIPVSKHEADSYGLIKIYKGKKYYLCCDSCTTMFDKNPAQYVQDNESGVEK